MTSVLQEICEWASQSLQYWEQSVLDKLISNQLLSEGDYEECLEYLLQDHDLSEKSDNRPEINFVKNISVADSSRAKRPKIRSIHSLQNVNALISDQKIVFNDSVTVVYGVNGSGKSGYARVLGCAGFTRGDKEILSDVLTPTEERKPVSAIIEITDDTDNTQHLQFSGERLSELKSFYMFDSTSIKVHLTDSNDLSFSPAGLAYLKFLAEETDKVRSLLADKITANTPKNSFLMLFAGDSEINRFLKSLNSKADLKTVRDYAVFSPIHKGRMEELDQQIAQLKSQNTKPLVSELQQDLQDMRDLRNQFNVVIEGLNEERVQQINRTVEAFLLTQEAAQEVGVDEFKRKEFTHIGSSIWMEFATAAKRLADVERPNEPRYPTLDDICLLCHQPLHGDSVERMHHLWRFLETGAQSELRSLRRSLNQFRETFEKIEMDFLDETSIYYRYLGEQHPDLLKSLAAFVARFQNYRQTVVDNLLLPSQTQITILDLSELGKLDILISDIESRIQNLDTNQGIDNEIEKLEGEYRLIEHRSLLSQYLYQVENYVKECIWVDKATKIGGNTKRITKKHDELFNKLVTQNFIDKFEDTLKRLGRPLKVKIDTISRKGQTYRQIVLRADNANIKTKPDRVLSEGEKRAVAFADFFTEVSLDNDSCSIILDDPVTSLDLEWRKVIAELLVEESKRRQVIIFTHDIPFVYLLGSKANSLEIPLMIHWIKRGDNDDRPGYVYLENGPMLEQEYKKSTNAESFHKRAKDEAQPSEQMRLLQQGMAALRTSYEAFVVFELFKQVVQRYDDRININSLKEIVWDTSIVQQIITKHAHLSRYIEGHLHVDNSPHNPLSVQLLRNEIDEFNEMRRSLQELRKMI